MRTYELESPVPTKAMDISTSRYWTICIIANPLDKNCNLTKGYRNKQSTLARNFFEEEFPEFKSQTSLSKGQNEYVQVSLWNTFHNQTLEREQRAMAGLCLRCYVSSSVIEGCHILTKRAFGKIRLDNLLSYILNDDGNTFVVVDSDDKTQFIVKENGEIKPIPKAGNFFSVEVLSSYNPNLSDNRNSESLDNWCIRRIKQNKDLQTLLLEYGVSVPSDWSLLCREVPQSLRIRFTDNDCRFIEVFHAVYRRDRRKFRQRGRCNKPSDDQLKEMQLLLEHKSIVLGSEKELIPKFKEIAEILRQDNHSIKTGKPQADSIDVSNCSEENNDYFSKLNQLGTEDNNCEDMEENELREILHQLPPEALYRAISLRIPQRVEILAAKKPSRAYAKKFVDGLRQYYHEVNPLSLKEIAEQWDINWAKARSIFEIRKLIDSVKSTSEDIFISKIKEQASQFFASEVSGNPNNLKHIAEEVRSFLDQVAFKEARAEIIAARSPYKNSLFAQILRKYMNH